VREGSAITVALPAATTFRRPPAAEPGSLSILYEDQALMVVDKPAGTVVHPSYKASSGTLLNAVLWHLGGASGAKPGIVTRIDKDTSGLVLIAKTAGAHAALQRQGSAGGVRKQYLAIVNGWPRPARGSISHPLGRDPGDRRRVIVMPGGAASETRYDVVSRWDRGARESLLCCELVTGRTHQIRVHLAAEGWPIIGDRTYGSSDPRIARQALHAWRLSFAHPATRDVVEVEAPLPEDMTRLAGEEATTITKDLATKDTKITKGWE
jgi:23S rRNA pseudouridine1911/1915/1917 synthase